MNFIDSGDGNPLCTLHRAEGLGGLHARIRIQTKVNEVDASYTGRRTVQEGPL